MDSDTLLLTEIICLDVLVAGNVEDLGSSCTKSLRLPAQ